MISRGRHLQEERLFDSYITERGGTALDPPVAEHLADCEGCGARYRELLRLMDALRREADADTHALFTPERLRAQHQHIVRRLAHVGRPARIIDFPIQVVARHMSAAGARGITRWVYAAAAAGLVVGVGLGAVYQSEWTSMQTGHRRTAAVRQLGPHVTPVAATSMSAADGTEDAFLSDLDVALERPHTRTLQAFDALTPHVRDVSGGREKGEGNRD